MSLPLFNCPKFRSQWDLQLLLQVKEKKKILQIMQIKNHNKIILASDKTRTKKTKLYFIKKHGISPQCDWITKCQKEQNGAKFKNTFLFLITINITNIDVIR